MEPEDLKAAWQSLEARMARSDQLQLALLRETRLVRMRRHLRPLAIGQGLQLLLGAGLIALGVACWTRNPDTPGLLITGLVVHAFGLLTLLAAVVTLVHMSRIDPAAPVLEIQRRLASLLRVYGINAALCGVPWWVMWILVVVAFAGLGEVPATGGTPAWITWNLAIGVVGTLATWAYAWHRRPRGQRGADSATGTTRDRADGADGIRRSQRLLAEISEFEAG